MNILTGAAKLELVINWSRRKEQAGVIWVVTISINSHLSYCLQSGRGRYLGLLTLLALVFSQIRWSSFWKSNWSEQQRDDRCTGKLWRRVLSSVWWWSASLGWASPPWYETSHSFFILTFFLIPITTLKARYMIDMKLKPRWTPCSWRISTITVVKRKKKQIRLYKWAQKCASLFLAKTKMLFEAKKDMI